MTLSLNLQLGLSPRQTIDPDVVAFQQRVIADGGTVEDINFLNSFVNNAKQNNYYDDIVAAGSPSWGVKGTTTSSKLYSITGAATDIEQTTGANQPAINLLDLNGRTRLLGDGVNDLLSSGVISAIPAPWTVEFMGMEQEAWSAGDRFFDGVGATLSTVRQSFGVSPQIQISSVATSASTNDLAVATPGHLRVLADGPNSEIQVNNNAAVVNGPVTSDAITDINFFAGPGFAWSHMSAGGFIIRDSANDAGYVAKSTAIYNFSNSAYGTP